MTEAPRQHGGSEKEAVIASVAGQATKEVRDMRPGPAIQEAGGREEAEVRLQPSHEKAQTVNDLRSWWQQKHEQQCSVAAGAEGEDSEAAVLHGEIDAEMRRRVRSENENWWLREAGEQVEFTLSHAVSSLYEGSVHPQASSVVGSMQHSMAHSSIAITDVVSSSSSALLSHPQASLTTSRALASQHASLVPISEPALGEGEADGGGEGEESSQGQTQSAREAKVQSWAQSMSLGTASEGPRSVDLEEPIPVALKIPTFAGAAPSFPAPHDETANATLSCIGDANDTKESPENDTKQQHLDPEQEQQQSWGSRFWQRLQDQWPRMELVPCCSCSRERSERQHQRSVGE